MPLSTSLSVSDVPCTQQDYFALVQNSTFRKLPRGLLSHIVRELKNSELALYLVLYDQSEYNRYAGKSQTVSFSYAQLGEKIGKSSSTSGRALLKLKELGWIQIFSRAGEGDNYLPNDVLVSIPSRVAKRLLLQTYVPTQSELVKQPRKTDPRGNDEVPKPVEVATPSIVDPNNEIAKPTTAQPLQPAPTLANSQTLLQRYNDNLKALKADGYTIIEASKLAFKNFNKDEQASIFDEQKSQKRNEELSSSPSFFCGSSCPDLTGGNPPVNSPCPNNSALYKERDNKRNLLKLTLELGGQATNPASAPGGASKTIGQNAAVNNNKNSSGTFQQAPQQVHSLSASEKDKLLKKINWLSRSGLIKGEAASRPIQELISEVIFHTQYCRTSVTPTFNESLKGAQTLLEAGRWRRPHRLTHIDARGRERAALDAKREELADFRKVWGNGLPIPKLQNPSNNFSTN